MSRSTLIVSQRPIQSCNIAKLERHSTTSMWSGMAGMHNTTAMSRHKAQWPDLGGQLTPFTCPTPASQLAPAASKPPEADAQALGKSAAR